MRIACVHVPQFALQTLTRIDPSLRGAAVAVVGAGHDGALPALGDHARRALTTPVVQACSRAAWGLGVRLGMTATSANSLAPGQLRVVTADPRIERETVRAIADALLAVSAQVDVGGRIGAGGAHLAMYCEVPSKTRGTSYGDRLLEVLASLGLTARIGIADDRFTAWVAAATAPHGDDESGVVSVPRGGSAAFLAPRPLSLLAISSEVQHMLESLGVRTLGEFAALPAPSVARPLEADYQALARGEGGQGLRAYVPDAPIREELVVSPGGDAPAPAGAAIALLAERIALRLAGRGRGAARLEIVVAGPGGESVVPVAPLASPSGAGDEDASAGRVLETADEIAGAIEQGVATAREAGDGAGAIWRLRVAVIGEAIPGDASATELVTPQVAPAPTTPIDALSVVLSSTGSGAWRLTSPLASAQAALRSERRDAHRRTRRGKQHRRLRAIAEASVQPGLFAERK